METQGIGYLMYGGIKVQFRFTKRHEKFAAEYYELFPCVSPAKAETDVRAYDAAPERSVKDEAEGIRWFRSFEKQLSGTVVL